MSEQAASIRCWPERNRLRFAAARLDDMLGACLRAAPDNGKVEHGETACAAGRGGRGCGG